jgi:hypothetical protein
MASNNASKIFSFPNTVIKDIDYANLWNVNITYGIGGAYTYDMTVSTVNQMIPSNYLISKPGNISAAKYIYLQITALNGGIISITIEDSATPILPPPVLENLVPGDFKIAIGVIGTDGFFYKFVAGLPITATPAVSFESDRPVPIPGLSTRIQWWTWTIKQQ